MDWKDGYVIVVYDGKSKTYEYYITAVDKEGYKVEITVETKLTRKSISKSDDLTLSVGCVIEDRDQVIIYGPDEKTEEIDSVY